MLPVTYVMAHAYSGTTLLSLLLGHHPRIATVGEMSGIAAGIEVSTYSCSCGALLVRCPLWTSVIAEMAALGLPFDLEDFDLRFRARRAPLSDRVLRAGTLGRLGEAAREVALNVLPGARRDLPRVLRRNEAFVEVVTRLLGRSHFVDISKRPGRALHLRRIRTFDLRVVHMVRDVRAVAYSCFKNQGMSAGEAALSWLQLQRQAERSRWYFPDNRWLLLRHEDLCAEPKPSLDALFGFIGVQPRPPADRLPEHHVIGNRMRLVPELEIRLDESWKTALQPGQLREIDRIAGEANRCYGYPP